MTFKSAAACKGFICGVETVLNHMLPPKTKKPVIKAKKKGVAHPASLEVQS